MTKKTLIEQLRNCSGNAAPCKDCELCNDPTCSDTLMKLAADCIERLSVIASWQQERASIICKNCWFYNAEQRFCDLHEAEFGPDAFCSYATSDGMAKYWGLSKEDHDSKMLEENS